MSLVCNARYGNKKDITHMIMCSTDCLVLCVCVPVCVCVAFEVFLSHYLKTIYVVIIIFIQIPLNNAIDSSYKLILCLKISCY